jgi:hypothetical protein
MKKEIRELQDRLARMEAQSPVGFIHLIPDECDESIHRVTLAARSLPVITPHEYRTQMQERFARHNDDT